MSNMNGTGPDDLYLYTLSVAVDDKDTLQRAAEAAALRLGINLDEWRASRQGPESDLVIVLDPGGAPPGCRIIASAADKA